MREDYKKQFFDKNYYSLCLITGYNIDRAYSSTLHYDVGMTLTWFKCGDAKIRIEGKPYEVKESDALILNRNELHRSELDHDRYYERLSLYINESIASALPYDISLLLDAFLKRELGVGNKINAENISSMGVDRDLERLFELAKNDDDTSNALGLCLVVQILAKINGTVSPSREASLTFTDKVLEYINESFTCPITCEDISERFHINKFHLERIFKQSVGISLWDYVINRRIIYCNKLMRQGYSVKEASFLSGFNNYSNFYRLYKKHTGITPIQYKKNAFLH